MLPRQLHYQSHSNCNSFAISSSLKRMKLSKYFRMNEFIFSHITHPFDINLRSLILILIYRKLMKQPYLQKRYSTEQKNILIGIPRLLIQRESQHPNIFKTPQRMPLYNHLVVCYRHNWPKSGGNDFINNELVDANFDVLNYHLLLMNSILNVHMVKVCLSKRNN